MTRIPNACEMPTPARDAEIYRGIRDVMIKAHCAAGRAHKCCGEITITARHITFACNLCGDARQTVDQ
jgi:hypothetical protein